MIGIQRSVCELFCPHLLDFLSEASFLGRALFIWLSGLLLACSWSSFHDFFLFMQPSSFLGYETLLLGSTWLRGRKVFCCCTLESDCLVCLESRGVYFGAHLANDTTTRKLTRAKDNLP